MAPKRKQPQKKFESETINAHLDRVTKLMEGEYAVDPRRAQETATPVRMTFLVPTSNGKPLRDATFSLSREFLASKIPGASTDSPFHVSELEVHAIDNTSGSVYALASNSLDGQHTGAAITNLDDSATVARALMLVPPGSQHVAARATRGFKAEIDTDDADAARIALYPTEEVRGEIQKEYDDEFKYETVVTAGGIIHQIVHDSHEQAVADAKRTGADVSKVFPPKPRSITSSDPVTGEEIVTHVGVHPEAAAKVLELHKTAVHDKWGGKRVPDGDNLTFTLSPVTNWSLNKGAGYVMMEATASICCLK